MPQYASTEVTTTLTGAISASAKELSIGSIGSFPTGRYLAVKIGDEVIIADRVSGNVLLGLQRGADGTTQASHADGAVVTLMEIPEVSIAGTYGSSSKVAQVAVDNTGRVTNIQEVNIAHPAADAVSSTTAPTSATATGTAGQIRFDAGYVYVCVAANTWKRAALTTWT